MFSNDKMDAIKLREVAKQRGMHGYSNMPKAKLIAAVRETEKQRKISDFYKSQPCSIAQYLICRNPFFSRPRQNRNLLIRE